MEGDAKVCRLINKRRGLKEKYIILSSEFVLSDTTKKRKVVIQELLMGMSEVHVEDLGDECQVFLN